MVSAVPAPAAPAAEEVDAEDALKAAVVTYNTNRKYDLHFTALAKATRAPDVLCEPLTADSDVPAIESACEALAARLSPNGTPPLIVEKDFKMAQKKLVSLLAYPDQTLLNAFAATLCGPQGGEVEQAVERELAVRRVSIVGLVIAPAPSPAHVKMKDLFRFIREHYPDVVRHTRTHDRPSVDQPYQR